MTGLVILALTSGLLFGRFTMRVDAVRDGYFEHGNKAYSVVLYDTLDRPEKQENHNGH